MSDFTYFLKKLSMYSESIDNDSFTYTDFYELKEIVNLISFKMFKTQKLTRLEYKTLIELYEIIMISAKIYMNNKEK